jgi:hypothetical protein
VKESRRDQLVAAALVTVMCGLAAWRRWLFLDESPYPTGVDGYFYAVQLRSILEHGHLHWPASPLAFWLMAPFAALTDPIVGAKLGAALGGALAGVPAYALGRRLGGGHGAGLLACAIVTASAGSFYLSAEFVKQGFGVTVALTALVAILRALEQPTRARIAAAAAAVLATLLTHKMAAVLVVVTAGPALIVELRARSVLGAPREGAYVVRRGRRLVIGALVAGVALLIAAGLLFPARFPSPADLHLVTGLFAGRARWSLPALDLGDHALAMGHEALAGVIAAALLAAGLAATRAQPIGRPAERALAIALAALALVIAVPWLSVGVGDLEGLGFRLRLVAFVPLALVGAAALGRLVQRFPVRPFGRDALVALFALGWLAVQPPRPAEGIIGAHPALVEAARALEGVVPEGDTVVVTERHLAFIAAYYGRVSVALDPETVPRARRWRLLTLFFITSGSPLDHALLDARRVTDLVPPRGLHARDPNGVVLVAEPTWDWVLEHLPPKARAWAAAWHTS